MSDKEIDRLQSFVKEQKNDTYLIDGPRDTQESTICRKGKDGSTNCLKLKIASTRLFAEMVYPLYVKSTDDESKT